MITQQFPLSVFPLIPTEFCLPCISVMGGNSQLLSTHCCAFLGCSGEAWGGFGAAVGTSWFSKQGSYWGMDGRGQSSSVLSPSLPGPGKEKLTAWEV